MRFGLRSVAIAVVITALTLLAYHHWPTHYNTVEGKPHKLPNYPVAYVLYGSIAFFWLVLPSLRRLITGTEPTIHRCSGRSSTLKIGSGNDAQILLETDLARLSHGSSPSS